MRLNNKLKAMIQEVCYYATFLLLLVLVINTNQDSNAYLQNADLTKIYTSNMSKVCRTKKNPVSQMHNLNKRLYY